MYIGMVDETLCEKCAGYVVGVDEVLRVLCMSMCWRARACSYWNSDVCPILLVATPTGCYFRMVARGAAS
jgi:hypothetical protein